MTPEQRKSYAQALVGQKSGATWTNIPPARTGRQVEGASLLPFGRYEMPDGSSQVSFGLPQGALDAYRSMRYGLGFEQDPNAPPGYVSEDAISRGAFGAAGAMATGGIAATTASRAAGRSLVPDNSLGILGFGKSAKQKEIESTAKKTPPPIKPRPGIDSDDFGNYLITTYKDDVGTGKVMGLRSGDDVVINHARLDPSLRGQGIGIDMYRNLIDRAHSQGHHVRSDTLVSDDALRVYKALKGMGYDVRKNPNAVKLRDSVYNNADRHIFRVAKPGTPGTEFFSSSIPGLHATEDDY